MGGYLLVLNVIIIIIIGIFVFVLVTNLLAHKYIYLYSRM